jgi:hypothetical protein
VCAADGTSSPTVSCFGVIAGYPIAIGAAAIEQVPELTALVLEGVGTLVVLGFGARVSLRRGRADR